MASMGTVQGNLLLPSSLDQKMISMDEELWFMVEKRAQEIICTVQANVISDANRKKIIDFVQRLIRGYLRGEAFVFGSVPLKTYLPDGDIDLTVLSHESVEEDLPQAVCNLLESGEDLEYEVKDIQYIRAQVKVVKCTVKNIAVDISFNQMGGLYALRFLEQVLYRFLDYYSTFDWEKNYVTVDGPQALSSLPEIVGNLHRIRFALTFGARQLKEILKLPGQSMGGALEVFFMNTLNRNGKGQRPDIDVPVPAFGTGKSEKPVLVGDCDSYYGGLQYVQLYRNHAMPLTAHSSSPSIQFDVVAHSSSPSIPLDAVAHSSSPLTPFDAVAHLNSSAKPFESVAYSSFPSIPFDSVVHSSYLSIPVDSVTHSSSSSLPFDADLLALQQNWYMYYYRGADLYAPRQTFIPPNAPPPPPTYSLEDIGKSRGTGTYIPDMTHSTYWNVRARSSRPRRFIHGNGQNTNNNASPSERKKMEEVLPETNVDDNNNNNNSKSFELSNEDFPILESIGNTSSSAPKKSEQDQNSAPRTELSLGTKVQKGDSSVSFSQYAAPVVRETNMDDNNNSMSFKLSNEDFPILESIFNTRSSTSKISEQDQNAASLKELSLGTKDQKGDSSVSSSKGAAPVVPSLAVEAKEKCSSLTIEDISRFSDVDFEELG
ncbi:hypothetical protein TSUD_319390 [Trifolium subterraneum]|uniref:Uncharacterized protein n=1 Tax=Trifolium subterraneum TaxID=3900 RepID=A0A2Z6MGC0_TRISU|nr:hypothetical protein TSUD_319390 [Trifolium subterraneum]